MIDGFFLYLSITDLGPAHEADRGKYLQEQHFWGDKLQYAREALLTLLRGVDQLFRTLYDNRQRFYYSYGCWVAGENWDSSQTFISTRQKLSSTGDTISEPARQKTCLALVPPHMLQGYYEIIHKRLGREDWRASNTRFDFFFSD